MILTKEQLVDLSNIAVQAALKSAKIISEYAQKDLTVERKSGGSLAAQVVTEVDRMSQETILNCLRETIQKYDLGVLTEESEDDRSRLHKDYFWCIDPLDGTLSFTEKREGYSVSIALVSKNGVAQTGIVVDPVTGTVYQAVKGEGVLKNGRQWNLTDLYQSQESFTLICDKGFINHPLYNQTIDFFKKKVAEWGFENLNITGYGGAVMNACWVLENAPACYFKYPKKESGGGSFWDYAATASIYSELGATFTDFNGVIPNFNRNDSTFMNEKGILYSSDRKTGEAVIRFFNEMKIERK